MPGSATVTVADILELRAAGLTEEETWAVLCRAAQTLQDMFLSKVSGGKIVPVVSPHTLGINSKGRIVISFVSRIHGHHEPYLAPEYITARDANNLDWEKMWVYSLGKTLLSASKDTLATESSWVLEFMTAKESTNRASLMSLLNIVSRHCETNLPVKPFSHLMLEMYREVFGTPLQCLFPSDMPGGGQASGPRNCLDSLGGGGHVEGSGGSGGRREGRKKPVERAPSRLYRGPRGREGGRTGIGRCVGPEFVVRGMEPWKVVHVGEGDGRGSGRREVTVVLLTGQRVRVRCDPQSMTCSKLLEVLVQVEGIEDDYMFGVAWLVKGDFVFVPGEMKLHKVAPRGWKDGCGAESNEVKFLLYVRVKLFLGSVREFKSSKTKHMIYLQLRRSLLEQQIKCEPEELIVLGGLALQAEFGNFEEKEHGTSSYFLLEHYLPDEVIEERARLEARLQEQHRSSFGLEPALAEEIFVARVQRLAEYGSHHYTALWVRKSVSIPMWVTVNPHGIYLYEKKKKVLDRKIHETFIWKNIQGFSCNEHYFRLSPQDVLGRKLTGYKLRMDSKKSYFLFRLASFHHQFFLKLRKELSPLDALSLEFGVRSKKEGKESLRLEVEEQRNKENESPEGSQREKRTGVRMGVSAFRSRNPGGGSMAGRPSSSGVWGDCVDAYVLETSITSSSGRFTYDLQESISSGLLSQWEKVSWQEERVLKKVRLMKDKYGCFGLEIVEGGNGGLFVKNVLKGEGADVEAEAGCVRKGDQLVSVNGICLLNLNYQEALSVLRGMGNEMEVLVSQSCNRQTPQKPLEYEYLKNIRYETANEVENLECDFPFSNALAEL